MSGWYSGTRRNFCRSASGVSTMKMMSSTSTTSMSGVTLMSVTGRFVPSPIAMALLLLLELGARQAHAHDVGLRDLEDRLADDPVRRVPVALHQHWRPGVKRHLLGERGGDRVLLVLGLVDPD